jgi:hypothetical protein
MARQHPGIDVVAAAGAEADIEVDGKSDAVSARALAAVAAAMAIAAEHAANVFVRIIQIRAGERLCAGVASRA